MGRWPCQQGEAQAGSVVAILCVGEQFERWGSTIASLVSASVPVVALTSDPQRMAAIFEGLPFEATSVSLGEATAAAGRGGVTAVFVATRPVVVPPAPFESAVAAIDVDIRIASVSFFSNDANYLTFPVRNAPSGLVHTGHDERSLTRKLRSLEGPQRVVPIPVSAGAGVLLAASAVHALGGLDSHISPDAAIVDFSLRAVKRGFRNVLDATTFIATPDQPGRGPDVVNDAAARGMLQARHHFFPDLYDLERDAIDTPLADAISVRSAHVRGLSVLIDGSCLGPYEMGTQVAVLSQINALADHPDVRQVVVATPSGTVPAYARAVLTRPEIRVCRENNGNIEFDQTCDVIHRPFQPTATIPFGDWRRIARRVVVTVQDLIAYDNGSYHASQATWLDYRRVMRESIAGADATIAISLDTVDAMVQARLPVVRGGIFVIENGTDHLVPSEAGPDAPARVARVRRRRGAVRPGSRCGLHAQEPRPRDPAWHELRARGNPVNLVLAGVVVPIGQQPQRRGARVEHAGHPLTLPDVTTAERNWLLTHAAACCTPRLPRASGWCRSRPRRWAPPPRSSGSGRSTRSSGASRCWRRAGSRSPRRRGGAAASTTRRSPVRRSRPRSRRGSTDVAALRGRARRRLLRVARRRRRPLTRTTRSTEGLMAERKATRADERPGQDHRGPRSISLEQALLDFDVANARVIDLTGRLTSLSARSRRLRHDLADAQAAELAAPASEARRCEPSSPRIPGVGDPYRGMRGLGERARGSGAAEVPGTPADPAGHHGLQRARLRAGAPLASARRLEQRRPRSTCSSSTTAARSPGSARSSRSMCAPSGHRLLPLAAQPRHPAQRQPRHCAPPLQRGYDYVDHQQLAT